jgi:hypothetical protein
MSNSVIGALRVMLGMDTAEFEKGATSAQRTAQRFEKDMTKLGGSLQKVGLGMTAALTVPLGAFGTASFKAASDAAELQSSFNQTFGALSGAMNKWAEQTGNAMGRSTRSMQQLANTFGIFFNQAAPTREEAAKMSQTFAVLAQDLGSFYNIAEEDALAKLRSGLAGESEPLRDFGVFMTEAVVQAKALEMGLAGANNPLTEQEKIMARYAIILEKTKNAQGDVARTSEGTANQMRASAAAFEELQIVVGTKLLPVFTPLITKLGAALEWFTQLPEPVQNFSLAAAGIAAAFGPVLTGIGTIITIAPKLVGAFNLIRGAAVLLMANPVILGFAAVLAGIYLAWRNWDKITEIVSRLYNGVKQWLVDKLGAVFDWLRDKIKAVTGFFFDMYDAVVGNSYVPDMVTEIGQEFTRLQGLMVDPAKKAADDTKEAFRQMASDVMGLLDRLFPEIARARAMAEDLKLLDGAGLSEEVRARARLRLLGGGRDRPKVSEDLLNEGPLTEVGKVKDATDKIAREMAGLGDKTEVQTVRVAETFQQMADRALGALRRLSDGIRGGDFLSIVEGIIGIGTTLGGFGVFGKKVQANLQSTPGFAQGGAMRLGGMAGMDRNVLSLNGSPIARVSAGETMEIRRGDAGGWGQTVVNNYYTLPSDEFWGRVDGRAGQVVAAAAPMIERGGAQKALEQLSRARERALA